MDIDPVKKKERRLSIEFEKLKKKKKHVDRFAIMILNKVTPIPF